MCKKWTEYTYIKDKPTTSGKLKDHNTISKKEKEYRNTKYKPHVCCNWHIQFKINRYKLNIKVDLTSKKKASKVQLKSG